MKTLIDINIGILIGVILYEQFLMPITLDRRAEELNWLQYSSTENKMITKPDKKWDLHYLKYGTMK